MNAFDTSLSRGLLLGAAESHRPAVAPDRRRSQWPLGPSSLDERADQAERLCFLILLIVCVFSVWQGLLV